MTGAKLKESAHVLCRTSALPSSVGVQSNKSVDTDTHRQAAARRIRDHASLSGLPVRAGHLQCYAARIWVGVGAPS